MLDIDKETNLKMLQWWLLSYGSGFLSLVDF